MECPIRQPKNVTNGKEWVFYKAKAAHLCVTHDTGFLKRWLMWDKPVLWHLIISEYQHINTACNVVTFATLSPGTCPTYIFMQPLVLYTVVWHILLKHNTGNTKHPLQTSHSKNCIHLRHKRQEISDYNRLIHQTLETQTL